VYGVGAHEFGPADYDRAMAGVTAACVFGIRATAAGVLTPNEHTERFCAETDTATIGFMALDPTDPDALDQLADGVARGLRGIKLYPILALFDPRDTHHDPFYRAAAEAGLVVLWHMGATPSPAGDLSVSNPLVVDEVARRHPDLVQIIAHLGHPWQRETIVRRRVRGLGPAVGRLPGPGPRPGVGRGGEAGVRIGLPAVDAGRHGRGPARAGHDAARGPARRPHRDAGVAAGRRPSARDGAGVTTTSLAGLETPALLVDGARMDRNVAEMAGLMRSAGVALRPHFKTSKCVEVARHQLAAGAAGLTCSTPAEVALLQDEGVGDLLWAHQPVGPAKVAFAVTALRRGGLTLALDSAEAAAPLAEAAARAGGAVPYLLEVDTGLGRAGVDPDQAVETAAALAALEPLELRGVLTHEGSP
jgi:hypothetical protein